MSQAREYAEAIWPIDIAVAIVFVLMFINMIMTIRNRQEPILYVSVWYITAGVILSLFVYAIGNVVWVPGAGALTGIPGCRHPVVLRAQCSGIAFNTAGSRHRLLCHSQCHSQSAIQPYPFPGGFLVAAGFILPHRDPSSAPGPGTHLAESGFHYRQYRNDYSGDGGANQFMVYGQRQTGSHPAEHRRQIRLCRQRHLSLYLHPGPHAIPAPGAAAHPLSITGWWPTRTWAFWVFRA